MENNQRTGGRLGGMGVKGYMPRLLGLDSSPGLRGERKELLLCDDRLSHGREMEEGIGSSLDG